ncbi:hypothetical protein [Gordonia terrae]
MATTYRTTVLTLTTGGALREATTTATTWLTLTSAKDSAEQEHGPITWRHADVTRPQWAIGTPTARPSAYDQRVVVAPASKGLDDLLVELHRRDAPTDLDALRASILARQGKGPAPQPTPDGGTAA